MNCPSGKLGTSYSEVVTIVKRDTGTCLQSGTRTGRRFAQEGNATCRKELENRPKFFLFFSGGLCLTQRQNMRSQVYFSRRTGLGVRLDVGVDVSAAAVVQVLKIIGESKSGYA